MESTFKKKLSAKTIVGDVKKMVRSGDIKNGQVIYRALGIAEGVRTGSSTYGEWVAFSGDFEVINMMTGETFKGVEFFPDRSFSDALLSRLNANPGSSVEFALEVAIEVSDDYPTGYAYVTRPIVENAHDRLGALRQRLAALPAPDATPETAAKPGKTKAKADA